MIKIVIINRDLNKRVICKQVRDLLQVFLPATWHGARASASARTEGGTARERGCGCAVRSVWRVQTVQWDAPRGWRCGGVLTSVRHTICPYCRLLFRGGAVARREFCGHGEMWQGPSTS
jgi:hypothetical protein